MRGENRLVESGEGRDCPERELVHPDSDGSGWVTVMTEFGEAVDERNMETLFLDL